MGKTTTVYSRAIRSGYNIYYECQLSSRDASPDLDCYLMFSIYTHVYYMYKENF
jgi:hypothetical protein